MYFLDQAIKEKEDKEFKYFYINLLYQLLKYMKDLIIYIMIGITY